MEIELTIAQFSATCLTVCDFPVTALESFTHAECARRGVQMKDKNQKSVSCYLVVFTHIQHLNLHISLMFHPVPVYCTNENTCFYKWLTKTFSKKGKYGNYCCLKWLQVVSNETKGL